MGSSVSRGRAKNKYDSSSSFVVIPQEVIVGEILVRLPVKSLVRFRCVCKSWKYLLTCDPDFVTSHLTRYSMENPYTDALLATCCFFPNKLLKLVRRLRFQSHSPNYLNIIGSVNGLVCVYHSLISIEIWNPATNQYKDVPEPPSLDAHPYRFGFGFDQFTNDYKVVLVTVTRECPLRAQVYSCNAASWSTKTVTSSFLSRGAVVGRPTILHRRPYWYNYNAQSVEDYYVTYFDIRDEVFRLLPGLHFVNKHKQTVVMANLKDSLAVMLYDDYPSTCSRLVDVYVLDERYGAWSKNYTLGPITIPPSMRLLHCFRNGDLLFTSRKYIKLVSIDPETNAVNRFGSGMFLYDYSSFEICSNVCSYIETLVSVKGMRQMYDKNVGSDLIIIERSF